jgi:hypothetical protein
MHVTISIELAGSENLRRARIALEQRLPASLTPAGNFRAAVVEDQVGLARDSTLSSLSGKFPPAAALADNMQNPTTTVVGSALLGFDGTYWRRIAADASGRLRVVAESVTISAEQISAIFAGYTYSQLKYVRGSYVTAPAANTALNSFTVPSGLRGAVLAVLIDATEGNLFDIKWTSGGASKSYRLRLPSDGVMVYDFRPGLNIDDPADGGTAISVVNVNAGTSGSSYKVDLLVGLW